MDELLHGLVQDIEGGYVHSLAVVVPAPVPWPLPAYEIALMASERAWDTQADMSVTVITPEDAPLALFGFEASLGMGRLLAERKIEIITSASCDIPKSGTIRIHPGDRTLEVDRIVALPELRGPAIVGLPHDSVGFIPIGEYAQVVGAERVWAAGDVAGYPIKHGGVSAQMADTAARSIAALAGAAVQPQTFDPSLEGVVLTGGTPRYLRRRAEGSDARQSEMLKLKRGDQTPKIAARYLAPQLAALAPLTPQHPETIEPVIAAR
jgi:sulfide:quinone oxidoreductase